MSETDAKLEALAKAIYRALHSAIKQEIVDEWWIKAKNADHYAYMEAVYLARAALRHLKCVNPAGEVFVPDVKAAVAAVTFILEHNQGMEEDGTLVRTESGRMAAVALRALTGGTDEG